MFFDGTFFVNHVNKDMLVETFVNARLLDGPLKLYEAGGGSKTIFSQAFLDRAHVVLVDISPEQVAAAQYANEAIVGNIEQWCRPGFFDVICCNNVLEHVGDAAAAIEKMTSSLRPGGLLIVSGPMPTSLQGWLTRLSPHAFHVWFYRHVRRAPHAGEPGHGPFPVAFSFGSDYRQILDMLSAKSFDVIVSARYPGTHTKTLVNRKRLLALSYFTFAALCKAVTLGRYQPLLTDFFLVAQRPGRPDDATMVGDERVREDVKRVPAEKSTS